MDTSEFIDALCKSSAYSHPVDGHVKVCQTHISIVFLAGDFAYKVKKDVDFGFVDYTGLDCRRHFCQREVELNRRLAPDVYLGVVPIVDRGAGLVVDRPGEPVEWAVKMRRLPDQATLESRLNDERVDGALMDALAGHLAGFHRRARRDSSIAEFGRFEVVADNATDNYDHTSAHVGDTVAAGVHARLRRKNEAALAELGQLIEDRAEAGIPCDCHGDLRLDHVYRIDGHWTVVDCIEFNDRFRYGDPIGDIAFLVMDLQRAGRRDLAERLKQAYLADADDADGGRLMGFYVAYRAAVRAKVEGIKADRDDLDATARRRARREARAHWMVALDQLEAPRERPGIVLIGGLPGTGKSTLANRLAKEANFEVIDTDVVRKTLAGIAPDTPATADYGEGIYTDQWSHKTYAECLRRAQDLLHAGKRVIVDATFARQSRRRIFLDNAGQNGVRGVFLRCKTSPKVARQRLHTRSEGPSDAGWAVYQKMAHAWEPLADQTARSARTVDAHGPVDVVVERALGALASHGLC